jgi:hypothetical protein
MLQTPTPTGGPKPTTRHARLRHSGACGRRGRCWRPACRLAFGPYLTIELLPDVAIAYCHGDRLPTDDPLLALVA